MHHTITRSAQSQADELETVKARVRALESQLRKMGVEPTTEHAYTEPSVAASQGQVQGEVRSFTSGNNQITIQPGPGSTQAAAMIAGVTETRVRKGGKAAPAVQPKSETPTVDDARLRMSLLEIDK